VSKLIIGSILTFCLVALAGKYPHVAVGLVAVSIVLIFKLAEWFSE